MTTAENDTFLQRARQLDKEDRLSTMRSEYSLPTMGAANISSASQDPNRTSLYFCGNSLGPLARKTKQYVEEELSAWGQKAVLGHWDHPFGRPWTKNEERVSNYMADIVGAKPKEVVAMSTLTSNLHTMLATFYRPHTPHTKSQSSGKVKHKIIYEAHAFPSDQYALASAVALAGFDPRKSLIALEPRTGERTLRTEDVVAKIEEEAASGEVALVMMAGLQYLTGQFFDVETITKRAQELDILVGWDLAHAFANIPMALHDWNVDFAVWCTYKYGSSGPGGIAGLFVHERWGDVGFNTCIGRETTSSSPSSPSNKEESSVQGLVRTAGWWGHDKSTRFSMPDSFQAMTGAAGWQMSNPSSLDMSALLGSLETLAKAPLLLDPSFDLDIGSAEYADKINTLSTGETLGNGHIMPALRTKSERLTAFLEQLLLSDGFLPKQANISIVTPQEARFRGSQLSICIPDSKASTTNKSTEVEDSIDKTRSNVPPPLSQTTLVARVHKNLEEVKGVICDIRNPDMLRLAPLAQYSTFEEVWMAARALKEALTEELGK
ncbi:hypothetical protein CBS101457_003474 [Exobasidium rhododendri]|nr:hypothetical protein CBS101457_003474 [Exobasidium rhododendri]